MINAMVSMGRCNTELEPTVLVSGRKEFVPATKAATEMSKSQIREMTGGGKPVRSIRCVGRPERARTVDLHRVNCVVRKLNLFA
jgi:hypothetical protein